MSDYFYVLVGAVLIVTGLLAKSLINEAEMPATEEERLSARPNWRSRLLVVGLGAAACAYGGIDLFRRK